jgi:UDP-3-O-[3-hydroxymyristoyl] glucosamine N-acyltransferase
VKFTLAELAGRLGGEVDGNGDRVITGVASLKDAGPGDLTFVAGSRYQEEFSSTGAGAVIAGAKLEAPGRDLLRVANPHLAFAQVVDLFFPPHKPSPGVHPSAVVEEEAVIDPSAAVAAFCFVGRGSRVGAGTVLGPYCHVGPWSSIGTDTLLHPRVTLLDRSVIGCRVTIHSGTVIGSDGFGYVFDGLEHRKIPQVGRVEIADDVEIGACVTIDRATVGATRIGKGTKIDNLVQIAHNVEVGEKAVIVAQVGIAGSTRIGNGALIGGQVAIAPHLVVGDGARLAARTGVLRDVPAGETMSGNGPLPHRQWLRSEAAFVKLPEIRQTVKDLLKRVEELEKKR